MYADQITAGRKRSVKERLNGDLSADDLDPFRRNSGKRLRPSDERWKHDLYQDNERPQNSKSIGPRDLRLKLQRKDQKQKPGVVRDLREKLSGIIQQQKQKQEQEQEEEEEEGEVERSELVRVRVRAKPASEITKPASNRYEPSKRISKQTPKDNSKQKTESSSSSSVDGFLKSLGLEKYSLTFQAEEVDMTALIHMTDADLKALGVPMGPRKKILLALESKA